MTVHIIADSACDLPADFLTENNIKLVPLGVHYEGQDFEDQVTIQSTEVYEQMRNGKTVKTSGASPNRFQEIFTELAKQGEAVIYPAFSSELSGTYQTAVMIANEVKEEYPDFQCSIVDTKCASLGHGLAVIHAAELSRTGKTLQEIETSVKSFSKEIVHLFTVDNLEYLARGGRISKASAFVGGLLNIKPLLHVEDGKLIPLEKIRGKKKAYRRILDLIEERANPLTNQTVAISHGDDEEAALEMKQLIQERFQPKEILINPIGAAIGAHAGPGTLAIFFLGE
ncbi:DegV family EDD domain-containing protein [Bacillus lacus]|uniref:DegV family EDD domain-containing protein n=1 Tax=Metabacillus lacus TaxID=1983721 RepID=A0A7X2J124_9BACI|nr:DegV family protein [Metabacillus lacus]MRX73486.1 DegV family EDD domain-containing protein [Metabacillus lacus]